MPAPPAANHRSISIGDGNAKSEPRILHYPAQAGLRMIYRTRRRCVPPSLNLHRAQKQSDTNYLFAVFAALQIVLYYVIKRRSALMQTVLYATPRRACNYGMIGSSKLALHWFYSSHNALPYSIVGPRNTSPSFGNPRPSFARRSVCGSALTNHCHAPFALSAAALVARLASLPTLVCQQSA